MLDDTPRSSRPESGQSGDPCKTPGTTLQRNHGDDTVGDELDAAGFRRLLDSTAEGIYQLDMNGRCVFCNTACVRLLGYDSPDELIGQRMHDLIHHTRRDGNAHPRSACEIYRAFQEGREIHVQDEILWRKDGTWFDVEYWSYPLVQDGERVGSVVTFVDDSERKRNEDELRRRTEQLAQASCLNRRVLVVDDRHDIRYLARYYIEQAGGLVEACSNGKEALERVEQAEASGEGFDALVMDMQMPVMDGYETSRRLRRVGFDRPILALTAAAMRGDREKCLRAGCDAHVSKPIDGHHLVEILAFHTEKAVDSESDAGPEVVSTKTRVLLVDDNRDLSDALGALLELYDHDVCVRNDADEVVDAAVDFQPHVVLLDIGLGARTGYEVLADLEALPGMQSATFIALSGRTSPEDQQRSLAAGFDHHVGKPVDIEELIDLFDAPDRR